MLPGVDVQPLATGSGDWLTDYGWAVLIFFILVVTSLFIWSYLSKSLTKMKAKESGYIDDDVARYVARMVMAMTLIALVYYGLYVLSLISEFIKVNFWDPYYTYILDLILIAFILLVAMLIVRLLRRVARKARMTMMDGNAFRGSAVEFTSLLLSYVVYVAAAVIVLLLLMKFFLNIEPWESIQDFLNKSGTKIGIIVVFVLAIFVVVKIMGAIFEDYKFRTKKFNPKVIDLFSDIARYVLYIIAFLTAVFMLFSIVGLESVGLVLILIILVFIILGIALSYSVIKNIVSGLALMNTDTFDVGDHIRIGDDLVCEVVEKNLAFTKVKTEEGETVEVPNNEINSGNILNYDRSAVHGITIEFSAPASVPHAQVEMMVANAIAKVEGLMKEPKPEVYARNFSNSKITYEVHSYVKDAMKAKRTRSDLIVIMQEEFSTDERMFTGLKE